MTFLCFLGLTVITMFFHDRLTTRATVHPSLPASMVNQIDPEPVACCKQNGAECGGITIASSYIVILDLTRRSTAKLDAFLRAARPNSWIYMV